LAEKGEIRGERKELDQKKAPDEGRSQSSTPNYCG